MNTNNLVCLPETLMMLLSRGNFNGYDLPHASYRNFCSYLNNLLTAINFDFNTLQESKNSFSFLAFVAGKSANIENEKDNTDDSGAKSIFYNLLSAGLDPWINNGYILSMKDYYKNESKLVLANVLETESKIPHIIISLISLGWHEELDFVLSHSSAPNVNYIQSKIKFEYHNMSLIHGAARFGTNETMKVLIKHGFNVNEKNTAERTPLFYSNTADIAKTLIENGNDIDYLNSYGETPLKYWEAVFNVTTLKPFQKLWGSTRKKLTSVDDKFKALSQCINLTGKGKFLQSLKAVSLKGHEKDSNNRSIIGLIVDTYKENLKNNPSKINRADFKAASIQALFDKVSVNEDPEAAIELGFIILSVYGNSGMYDFDIIKEIIEPLGLTKTENLPLLVEKMLAFQPSIKFSNDLIDLVTINNLSEVKKFRQKGGNIHFKSIKINDWITNGKNTELFDSFLENIVSHDHKFSTPIFFDFMMRKSQWINYYSKDPWKILFPLTDSIYLTYNTPSTINNNEYILAIDSTITARKLLSEGILPTSDTTNDFYTAFNNKINDPYSCHSKIFFKPFFEYIALNNGLNNNTVKSNKMRI